MWTGMGNRVACLITGPQHVLVVAGMNKVSVTEEDGIRRVRNIAAPPTSVLGPDPLLQQTGVSQRLPYSSDRICRQTGDHKTLTCKDRITVILIGESYGF